MIVTKTPGVQFLFCVCTQGLHHKTVAHGIESQSIRQSDVVCNQTCMWHSVRDTHNLVDIIVSLQTFYTAGHVSAVSSGHTSHSFGHSAIDLGIILGSVIRLCFM